ncbi:FAD-dependent oxidoreductase [Amycolatopsis suaedae]|uniref:Methyltransferase domain-containing protein n=1 Tax=Amycolatopsis suaedae TaxID=2510978 RepID=A0A4Q7JGK9_9PSEU|nr:FAD-dependent oxidoreductase [Amycolatopsis suaedae]RZQ65974.1 methyltransferase domain-containing protein [Amycolatopsis suaedae]
MTFTKRYDVVVVGGGAAGLSAALTLGRARRSVLVIDAGRPRNAPAAHAHNYLGREGVPPLELLQLGRAEIAQYGAEVVEGTVVSARRVHEGHFTVTLADGSAVDARRLVLATGVVDELPDIPGLAQRWGRDVLHCPFCHGWEVRDYAIAVVAVGPTAMHQALLWRQWTDRLTLLTNESFTPTAGEREQLDARDITVVDGAVSGLEITGDALTGIRLADGTVVACEAAVVGAPVTVRSPIVESLGLHLSDVYFGEQLIGQVVKVDDAGATSEPGVWAAGNVTSFKAQVISSAAAGVNVGGVVNADLVEEDTRDAVAARRGFTAETERHAAEHRRHHGHRHVTPGSEQEWDALYGEREQIWSGNPNIALVRHATDLAPGRALELGCGEGADTIWLARRGWTVTATDISGVALARAKAAAEREGVADRIDWQHRDLADGLPDGTFDLVTAMFLHAKQEMPRERILREAAAAVAPGGSLMVVGHGGLAPWSEEESPEYLPTPEEVLDSLGLPEGEWEVTQSYDYERTAKGPDGEPVVREDNVLMLRRRPVS